ncbi:MAG: DUF2927 domain-containing protein [Alphaproteobacteria bacterium]|nr:DUF2927 domain-containing protein [Alphaproteobacteria bacterium]
MAVPVMGRGDLRAETRLAVHDAATFLRFFDTLALSSDFGPFNNRPAWVRKWNGPISVVLTSGAESLRGEVEALIHRVSGWTGLPITIAPSGTTVQPSRVNVIKIRVIRRRDADRHFADSDIVCQTETHGMGGELHTGFIILSDAYKDCLKHEFMHVLGFDSHWRADTQAGIQSVLSFRDSPNRTEDFSRWDIMAIRLLDDRRIRAGMPRQTGLTIVAKLIETPPQRAALTPQPILQRAPVRSDGAHSDTP